MISIEELNEAKEIRKTNSYYAEKEYLQFIFLNAISKYPESFIFKGGTCLRICYGLERASEDLDFSTSPKIAEIKKIVIKCLKDFELLGIDYNIYAEKEFNKNLRMEIRFQGPLYKGNLRSTNTLKIDFNKGKVKNKLAKVIPKIFSDVPLFILIAMDEKEILAEKIRSLLNRKEPRDLYDIWALLSKGAELDKNLIYEKLKEENSDISQLKFPSKQDYEISLKNLVFVLPSYEQVVREVSAKLDVLRK